MRLSRGNASATCTGRSAQMVAHHTSNGCNLRPGDLLASGTVSGPDEGLARLPARAHLARHRAARRCRRARRARFLEDGDEVIMRGVLRARGLRADRLRRVPGPDRLPGPVRREPEPDRRLLDV